MMWNMWNIPSGMGWWMGFGVIWMVLFWGGIIALIIWAIKKLTERGTSTSKHYPLDIAKERYAKGEISEKEFENIKKNIS
jgi:putative membrane protein